jgi:hypothetical protein
MPVPEVPRREVNVADFFDPDSPTCGISEAIASLPETGGRIHIPAGTYVLRSSMYVPSRVSLAGEGSASVLVIRPLSAALLAADSAEGSEVLQFEEPPPFDPGDGIGLTDEQYRGWKGTHSVVKRVEGTQLWLGKPVSQSLSVERKAKAVNLFPGIWSDGETALEIRDLTIRGVEDYDGPWWDFTYSAVHVVSCERVRITNCTVTGWPSDGISVQRGRDVQVTNCQVHGCRGHGYHPGTGLGRSIWSHNIGKENGGDGLYFCMGVHHSVCSSNVFSGNKQNGIGGVANGGDHHDIISSNVCSYNGMCGIDANRGEEQVITGNLLLSNSQGEPGKWPGIRLHDIRLSLVQGNRCADDQETPTQRKGIIESGESDLNLMNANLCAGMEETIVTVGENSRAEGNLV